jgi:hypothetical protein
MIKQQGVAGGSTGLLVTITEGDVFVASAGDCRCVIGKVFSLFILVRVVYSFSIDFFFFDLFIVVPVSCFRVPIIGELQLITNQTMQKND